MKKIISIKISKKIRVVFFSILFLSAIMAINYVLVRYNDWILNALNSN